MSNRWRSAALATGVAVVALMSSSVLPAFAMGQQSPPNTSYPAPDTITVEGYAQTTVAQYVTQVSIGYNVTDLTLAAVIRDEEKAAAQLRSRILRLHIPAGDVQTTWNNGYSGNASSPSGNLQVNVVLKSTAQATSVLDGAGAYAPSFLQENNVNAQAVALNPLSVRDKLYRGALADARRQAETLAADAGKTLGTIVSVSTILPQNGGYQPQITGPYPGSPVATGVVQTSYGQQGQLAEPVLSTQIMVTFAIK